jgi:hypothetical protein
MIQAGLPMTPIMRQPGRPGLVAELDDATQELVLLLSGQRDVRTTKAELRADLSHELAHGIRALKPEA